MGPQDLKLEVEQLVLASGRTRWLSAVTREVEYVLGVSWVQHGHPEVGEQEL